WDWELEVRGVRLRYATILEQRFQRVEGFTRVHKRRAVLEQVRLRGDDITIRCAMTLEGVGYARHEFRGKVRGDAIDGSVRITLPGEPGGPQETLVLPWQARRVATSEYFAPTGVDVR